MRSNTDEGSMIYLNHAGTSWPPPNCVQAAVMEAMAISPQQWGERFERGHRAVCKFFGVGDPDRLLLTPGCTSSLAVGIEGADVAAGRRVLTSRWEHHAVDGPLRRLTDRGVMVDRMAVGGDSPVDLSSMERSLADATVDLVVFTAACNVTGDLLPFDSMIELSHRYGAMVLMDAAQIVGWVDLDLESLGADLVAFGGHKGLQGPWGIGGLYMADSARMKCAEAICALPPPSGFNVESAIKPASGSRPGYCDVGSVDRYALAGLESALRWLGESDRKDDLAVARRQAGDIERMLRSSSKVTLFSQSAWQHRLPTIAFSIDDQSSGETAVQLEQAGLIVGSGLQCSPQSHQQLSTSDTGLVRISIGVRQPEAEIEEAADRLKRVLDAL